MHRDLVASAALSAVALIYLVSALQLPSSAGQPNGLGPRAYPLVVATLLLAGSVALGARTTWRLVQVRAGHVNTDDDGDSPGTRTRWKPLASVGALTLLYLAVMGLLDFVIITALYLLIGVLVIREKRPRSARQLLGPAVFAVATAMTTYVVFAIGLDLGLPAGPVARILGT